MSQQNTHRLSEEQEENPRYNTSNIKHYRVLIAQTEAAAKGTKLGDLGGKKKQETPRDYSSQFAKRATRQSSINAAYSRHRE